MTLFDRIGRHVQLTLKGRELLVHAEKVVADAAKLRLAAGKPDMVQGVVKIGVGEVIAARSLVAMINELKRYFPGSTSSSTSTSTRTSSTSSSGAASTSR